MYKPQAKSPAFTPSKISWIACLTLLLFSFSSFAQGIRGKVMSSEGESLPFASIYISNLKDGASTNAEGEFEIRLPAGRHTLLVQYIGYETKQLQIDISEDWIEHNFVLTQQDFVLKEVQVKSKAEDPAYTIMRKAISKRKYHLMQYDRYEVTVYMKGTGEVTDAPFFMKKQLKDEGLNLNEAYTTESVSRITFEQPNKIEEKVISIRSTGENSNPTSPNLFINQSFYNNKVADAISPLAQSAFSYYRYQYIGSFREGNIEVNKIKVTPRSRGEQVFEGYIYIIENLWAIHSLDLQTSYMGFKISVKQNYAEVAPNTFMPVTHQLSFSGKVLGFAGEYKYLANCSNYVVELNQDLLAQTEIIDEKVEDVPEDIGPAKADDKDELIEALANEDKMTRKQFRKVMRQYEKEARKEQEEPQVISERSYTIDSLATKQDSAYWAGVRPVPLTPKEQKGYQRDDSLARVEQARITGKDSTNVIKKRRFDPTDLLLGGTYNLSPRTSFTLDPTLFQLYFNTVEGINTNVSGVLRHNFDSLRQQVQFAPTFRYGFSSEDFYAKGRFSYRRSRGLQTWNLQLEGGRFVEQFNEMAIHPHINTLSTLLFRKNYLKQYEKEYALAGLSYAPSPWLKIDGSLEWAARQELFNHTDYSFFYSDTRSFRPNKPFNQELSDTGFPRHEAMVLEANLSFRPIATYRIYNGRKRPLLDRSPELLLNYRKGIKNVLGSDVDYDHLELGINHGFRLGVRGRLEFELRGGAFLNNNSLYFMDYKHFDGNRTFLSSLQPAGSFRLLDYYDYSTSGNYFSGHTHYQFRKFLLTQIPELSFAGLRENIFLNYLKTEHSPHYYELGYSIDQIFKILRVEVAASFEDMTYKEVGLRIGVASFIGVNND